ncbi:MAG: 2'-5' RNA ligase family protein [Myxococcota bacterium]
MPTTYRSVFIALRPQPSPTLQRALGELRTQILQSGVEASLVHPDNDHITLAFLGRPDPREAMARFQQCTANLHHTGPLTIMFSHIGAFGSKKFKARVLFAQPQPHSGLLRVRDAYRSLADRDQTLHWTLARARSQSASDWMMEHLVGPYTLGQAQVGAVHLMANDGSGCYVDLQRIPL